MKFYTRWLMFFGCMIVFLTGCRPQDAGIIWEDESEVSEEQTEAVVIYETEQISETEIDTKTDTEAAEISSIYVDICGAVNRPGVYELNEGARVYEVIEMAGGLTKEADDTAINRAEILTDGIKIQIFTRSEMEERREAGLVGSPTGNSFLNSSGVMNGYAFPNSSGMINEQPADQRVNINTADLAALTTLPGIGETRASDIITYRNEHGGFQSIDEIMKVNGIKEGTFHKIEDKITTE